MNKQQKLNFIGIKITEHKNRELQKYANKYHNGNVSSTIREFINKGLSINSYKDEITFLRQMINEEIESTINPKMERIIAINVKSGTMSSASYFLNAKVIEKFVPPSFRENLEENIEWAKKMGVAYIKNKIDKGDKL